MSIRAIITEGFGSFGTVPDVIRMGFGAEGEVVQQVVFVNVGAGGEIDWQEYVRAKAHEKTVIDQITEKKKEAKKLQKKIKKVEKEVLPSGVLAKPDEYLRLEFRRDEIKHEIWNLEEQLKGLRITLEAVYQREAEEEDDEEVLMLL